MPYTLTETSDDLMPFPAGTGPESDNRWTLNFGPQHPATHTTLRLVLELDGARVALLSCDIAFIQDPAATAIRRSIATAIGTTPERVLLNYSHTHCGPTLPGFLWQDEDQQQLQQTYLQRLIGMLTHVTATAAAAMRPARVGSGSGTAPIGINRRELAEDGKIFLGENPEGPIDNEVIVVRVDEPDGRPIATLFNQLKTHVDLL